MAAVHETKGLSMRTIERFKTPVQAPAVASLFWATAPWAFPATLSPGQSSTIFNYDATAYRPYYGVGAKVGAGGLGLGARQAT